MSLDPKFGALAAALGYIDAMGGITEAMRTRLRDHVYRIEFDVMGSRQAEIGALRRALWDVRTHELNIDGSPCWCPTETEPFDHMDHCLAARSLFKNERPS